MREYTTIVHPTELTADSASARQLIRLNSLARTYVTPRPEIRGGGR